MKPICVKCERFYRPTKIGFYFIEGMPTVNGARPGKAEPEHWRPYRLWSGDRWQCPTCGAEIIHGAGLRPIKERHEPDFESACVDFRATLIIKDC